MTTVKLSLLIMNPSLYLSLHPYTAYGQLARRAVSARVAVNIDVRREQIRMGMSAVEILF
jgi:hypothetical protein